MSPGTWIAFVLADSLTALAPGPVVALVVSHPLAHGRRTGGAVVAARVPGDAACLIAAVGGVGAILAASALAFTILKLAGAVYLVFLGVKLWRAPPVTGAAAAPAGSRWRVVVHAFLRAALNPKSILFFMVFVPQVLDTKSPPLPRLAAMAGSVLVCGALADGGSTVVAVRLRRFIRAPRAQRAMNRLAGGTLLAEGVLAAVARLPVVEARAGGGTG